jgi:peptide chain release factor subunit 1
MNTAGKVATDIAQRIRNLAEVHMDEPVVLSVYLSLDPSRFATAPNRDAEIESLMDEARTRSEELELSHKGRADVDQDIGRVREWMKSSLDPAGAHGIAIFCCSAADVLESFRLSTPVGPSAHIGHGAHLEPLAAALPTDSWCVFLINRRTDTILRGSHDRLMEVGDFEDHVHGQHDQGGWSQPRYQRSVEKDVGDHVRAACDRLFESFRRLPFDKLLVGCPSHLWPEVEGRLHPYLVERLVSRFDAEVEHEGPDEVLDRVRPLIEQNEGRLEAELIERLAEQLGRGERAVAGLGPVLDALNASRVETMLIADGFHAPGVACPSCGWMGTQGTECPADGAKLERTGDIVGTAVRNAVLQSAAVHEVRYHEPDRALGGPIAALLRF